MDIDKVLFQKKADKSDSDYQKTYLEIYKLYVEMADRISLRRHNANSFFLTINSAIIAVLGYVQFEGHNLLIIDNANDSEKLLTTKAALKNTGWRVLITSRCHPDEYEHDVILATHRSRRFVLASLWS